MRFDGMRHSKRKSRAERMRAAGGGEATECGRIMFEEFISREHAQLLKLTNIAIHLICICC